MSDLRRTWLRGYRTSDVEIALAHASLQQERLQIEIEAGRQRTQAMQVELEELHARIAALRAHEVELETALGELRQRYDALVRDTESRRDAIVADAERRAAGLRTEALRELGGVQDQIEELLSLRGRVVRALRNAGEQIGRTLDLVGAEPHGPEPRPAEDLAERLSRWTRDEPG